MLKLNGGLGTSMGMTKAKSLLEVKDGLTFLDIIARQILEARSRLGARLPLVLMNSFATRDDSLAALQRWPDLASDVPPDFVQSKEPKIRADDGQPVEWPDNPSLEWAPPGHGDVYPSLVGSGMLDALLEHGYRYLFLSNSDNLGAVLDPRILAWIAREEIPSCRRWPIGPRRIARAAISPCAAPTAGSCCARPRRCPTRTRTPSRTSPAITTSTPTTSGSTCTRCGGSWTSAAACWGCR